MNNYNWKWYLKDVKQDKNVTVFSCFSCGGGSSMGYKKAGFNVIGNCEIDEKINRMYVKNNHPKYNYRMDIRAFNKLEKLPDELYDLDILDGSPPCTTFSMAGKREETWGKEKKFREGQAKQTLDDLFFDFIFTAKKLKPKIVIAENVTGLTVGNAKGYVNEIIKGLNAIGYDVQIFKLNSAKMDVPQARERIFFVANRMFFPKIKLCYNNDEIPFRLVRDESGVELSDGVLKSLLKKAGNEDRSLMSVSKRIAGSSSYFTVPIWNDDKPVSTLTAGGTILRGCDKTRATDKDFVSVSTFPQDYDFCGNDVQYVCGMSVPPNMMANIAREVWEQWLKK